MNSYNIQLNPLFKKLKETDFAQIIKPTWFHEKKIFEQLNCIVLTYTQ